MFIDTHCHLNLLVKNSFDTTLTNTMIEDASPIIQSANDQNVTTIINVGTSVEESRNSIMLARTYRAVYAVVGIHPNDATATWQQDFEKITTMVHKRVENKIVGIGECGIDLYHKDTMLSRQQDLFKAHIELALTYDLALVVHSRCAYDETLYILEQYKHEKLRAIIHCFSYDKAFADLVISWGCVVGIGAPVTYPKNNVLRDIAAHIALGAIVLETDAPFLPLQSMRGKKNHPQYIADIAAYIAQLRNDTVANIAHATTATAHTIFALPYATQP